MNLQKIDYADGFLKRILSIIILSTILSYNTISTVSSEVIIPTARFGTSSVGSTFYVIANGLGNLIQKHAGINMTVEPIGGSYANIFSLNADKIDYAITNSGAAFDGYYGVKPFERKVNIALIAQGQPSYRFILVRRDEHINTVNDLNGKILIGRRPALPEINAITNALLNTVNLTDINIVSTKNTKESLRHIRSGTVDGAIIPGGSRVPAVVQLFRDKLVDPLYLPDNIIKEMQKKLPPYIYTQEFPAGHFEGQREKLTVLGLNTYFITTLHTPEEQVYLITKTLFEHKREFFAFHNEAKKWTLSNTLTDPKIPYHPGAIRYFKEEGLWTLNLEVIQNKLLSE